MSYQSNDKFRIISYTKKFILALEDVLVNFPKNDYINKDNLYKKSFELLELIYEANYQNDLIKKKDLQVKIISCINIIDFYFERAYSKHYLSEKQTTNLTNKLLSISKMVSGWMTHD